MPPMNNESHCNNPKVHIFISLCLKVLTYKLTVIIIAAATEIKLISETEPEINLDFCLMPFSCIADS